MASTKANGDRLEGTLAVPVNYPDPVPQNVNMHPMGWAYGTGNKSMDKTAPAAVTLSSSAKTATTVTLKWTADTDSGSGIASYDVYNGATKVTSITNGALTYQVTGLTTATAYNFTVKAVDGAGNSSTSNSLAVTTS